MNSIGFFVGKFLPWLVFWFVLRVVFGIGVWQAGLVADLGMDTYVKTRNMGLAGVNLEQ